MGDITLSDTRLAVCEGRLANGDGASGKGFAFGRSHAGGDCRPANSGVCKVGCIAGDAGDSPATDGDIVGVVGDAPTTDVDGKVGASDGGVARADVDRTDGVAGVAEAQRERAGRGWGQRISAAKDVAFEIGIVGIAEADRDGVDSSGGGGVGIAKDMGKHAIGGVGPADDNRAGCR